MLCRTVIIMNNNKKKKRKFYELLSTRINEVRILKFKFKAVLVKISFLVMCVGACVLFSVDTAEEDILFTEEGECSIVL